MPDIKPKNTIYINNLNENIKQPVLKKSLIAVFSQCGEIVDIITSRNMKMRGQAFVAFKQLDSACAALEAMNGFPFFNKPMKIQFAKNEADCIAKLKGCYVERPKKPKILKEKKKKKSSQTHIVPCTSQDQVVTTASQTQVVSSLTSLQMPMQPSLLPGVVPMIAPLVTGVIPVSPATFPVISNPLHYEQPNSILFVTNLPQGTNNMMLELLFNRFSDFKEVRLVPGRHDIAFVEFSNENAAAAAKNSLQGFKLTPNDALNISFANK